MNLALAAVLLYAASVPLDMWVVPLVGPVSRGAAGLAIIVGGLHVLRRGRLQLLSASDVLLIAFVAWTAASLFWSADQELTLQRVLTNVQLLMITLAIQQLAVNSSHGHALVHSFLIGATIAAGATISNFAFAGFVPGMRLSALGFNPNDLGVTLALGIPFACSTAAQGQRWSRIVGVVYVPLAMFAIALTASRTAAIAACVALLTVPVMLRRIRWYGMAVIMLMLSIAGWALIEYTPTGSLDRLSTIDNEIRGGTLNARTIIWRAALTLAAEHPLGGVGAGAFTSASMHLIEFRLVVHNTFLSVLAETGFVGFTLFGGTLVALAFGIRQLRGHERRLWLIVIATWMTGAMTLTWEYRKPTWLMFAMLAVQIAVARQQQRNPRPPHSPDVLRPSADSALKQQLEH